MNIIREEKDTVLKKNSGMLSSLNDVKIKLQNKSDECLSLQSLIKEKELIIDNLRSDIEVSNNQKLELTEFVTNLKVSVKKLRNNPGLKVDG